MTNPYAASGGSRPAGASGRGPAAQSEDGWGPATRSSAARRPGRAVTAPPVVVPKQAARPASAALDGWTPAGPLSSHDQRATRRADSASASAAAQPAYVDRPHEALPERGLRWWAALLVLIAIAAVGGVIDSIGTTQARGGFNIGIIVASVVAILAVKRSHMFPVVIAPPIVYSGAALFQLYLRSSGLHDKKVVFDAAANYLVYGFPAIAAASAAVLIIAGIRLIVRK